MMIGSNVVLFRDTCNVYLLRTGREAVLIDFGDGDVLDHLAEFGVDRVTDVLVTHHHRDQVQGLRRAAREGIRIWVPPVERDLIDNIDEHWRTRSLDNDYTTRQDRFSLLEPVAVTGVVPEYRTARFGGVEVTTLPTPGHTVGSVSYLVDIDGSRLAFVGDLLHDGGTLWSLAATQWTYAGPWSHSGMEGITATALSCAVLLEEGPDLLLPSHGDPIDDPRGTCELLRRRLRELLEFRGGKPYDLDARLREPWRAISPHLLRSTASEAITYALLSDAGAALLIDFGYDLSTGLADGRDRGARRPLLASIKALKRQYGVDRVEVVVPTHYHDDHVAGINLLREVEGTQLWSPANVSPILADPRRYDLPCLWFDPIPVDRDLPFGTPVRWREYELEVFELPGHTLYAAAIAFRVDGMTVVATGDQQNGDWQPGERPELLNYQYRNRFRVDDFRRSAELYLRLRPDLLISGHWNPREVTQGYLEMLLDRGERLARLHRELLPLERVDFGAEGFGARIEPYRSVVRGGEPLALSVWVRNPFPAPGAVRVKLVVPEGWAADPPVTESFVDGRSDTVVAVTVTPPVGSRVRRARVAVDLTVAGTRFGQQAEALVTVA
ncbi:MAG: MBL fold metallo-hydrolase [Actinomycetota bacterium]|nr:MBL fold metallo-hydrolase [Actinomycetota bacterium]